MKLPEAITEQEAIDAVEHCTNLLAHKFVFGSHTVEDMKQLGWTFALPLLASGKYDASRGRLVNWLFIHLKNQYGNHLRDRYHRPATDVACKTCREFLLGTGDGHEDGFCSATKSWLRRNATKATLAQPCSFPPVPGVDPGSQPNDAENPVLAVEDDAAEKAASNDLFRLIDEQLPLDLRADYLKLQAGVTVSKYRREAVQDEVRRILEGVGMGEMVPGQDEEE